MRWSVGALIVLFSLTYAERALTSMQSASLRLWFVDTDQGQPITPKSIAVDAYGMVIAGSAGPQAWAVKIDRQGSRLWTYVTDKPAGSASDRFLQAVMPEFSCSALADDGSVWLVGSTVKDGRQAGLIAHLSKDGAGSHHRNGIRHRLRAGRQRVLILPEARDDVYVAAIARH